MSSIQLDQKSLTQLKVLVTFSNFLYELNFNRLSMSRLLNVEAIKINGQTGDRTVKSGVSEVYQLASPLAHLHIARCDVAH